MARRKNPLTVESSQFLTTGAHVEALYEVDPGGGLRLVRLTFTGTDLGGADVRAFPFSESLVNAEMGASVLLPTDVPPFYEIGRPDGTDDWYQQFAKVFTFAKRHGQARAPATFLAERNGVPVTTIHRWTREARRRGFLPPDPRGKRTQ
ncbi:hypothetical protein [Nocardioides sp. zg-1228]|uniref:hypothetical protein n=1 Tax=Nocardioides sp. zg-1228 TaxID=2763008 RepID=UPI00164342AA|nr:hypothetical protein [Nocardioides sp. zg-1228]MBC2934696.1 hypothetical protein [Nocardioides sp. zg-1228]QSF56014.1 hypothetical protein JX575_09935 [Nocardioides sp. zg-1228]